MSGCLVIYYSRSGFTEKVAHRIARAYNCDLEAIRERDRRGGLFGFIRSIYQSIRGQMPDILSVSKDPGNYQAVILGTPVWAGHMSAPMRTYVHRYGGRFQRVALFCTMGGSGGDKALAEIAALCGKAPLARIALTDREIEQDRYQDKLDALKALPHG